jgi:hypothetical protein
MMQSNIEVAKNWGFKLAGAEATGKKKRITLSCKMEPEVSERYKAVAARLKPYGHVSLSAIIKQGIERALSDLEGFADEYERQQQSLFPKSEPVVVKKPVSVPKGGATNG